MALSRRGLSDMNAGFWIKLLPAASVYKCEPAKAERIQAGTSLRAIRCASGRLTMSLLRPFVASG